MDQELIPSLDVPISDIPNIPISLPMPFPTEESQFSSDILNWVNLFYGSNCDHNMASSPSVSLKAKNIASEGDHKTKGTSGENKAKVVRKKKAVPQRIAFHTRSDDDVLDDGYRWRKYGQKTVKNNHHPRSYYRCSHHTCSVKKQIQRLAKDKSTVVTTYEGVHNHPCERLMESLGPILRQLQFLYRI